jgi:cell division protein FtsL
MQNINFLEQQSRKLTAQQEKDQALFKKALIFFAAVTVIFFVSFGLKFYLQLRVNKIKEQITTAQQQINSSQELEADYLFFVDKLKIIRQLFDNRSDKQIAMGFFQDLFGPNINISGLTYDMETGILSLTVSSPHVFYLEEALDVLDDPAVKKHFASMTKTALMRNLDASYNFRLNVSFSEDSELVEKEQEY